MDNFGGAYDAEMSVEKVNTITNLKAFIQTIDDCLHPLNDSERLVVGLGLQEEYDGNRPSLFLKVEKTDVVEEDKVVVVNYSLNQFGVLTKTLLEVHRDLSTSIPNWDLIEQNLRYALETCGGKLIIDEISADPYLRNYAIYFDGQDIDLSMLTTNDFFRYILGQDDGDIGLTQSTN